MKFTSHTEANVDERTGLVYPMCDICDDTGRLITSNGPDDYNEEKCWCTIPDYSGATTDDR